MKLLLSAVALAACVATSASAAIINVSGPNSSAGTAAAIIAAPTLLQDSNVFNTGQQGFDELEGVLLGAGGVETDQGFVGQNMRVDSHMIFLNKRDGVSGSLSHFNVVWKFSGTISA